MRWTISFTQRLLLSVFLSQLVLTFILFGTILFFVEQGYKQQFVDRVRSSTGLYASQLPNIDSENFKIKAQTSLDELLFDGLAIFVKINIPDSEPIESDFNVKNLKFIEDFFFGDHNDSIYFVEIPISNIHSSTRGNLQIGFDESHVEEQIASAYSRGAYLISAYLLTTFFVILVVAQMLTKPLRKIRDAANRIAGGNDRETLSITSNVSEIESLASDLEFMRTTLLNHKIQIEDREKYISSIMNNMANALVVTDIFNNIKSINISAEILFGCKNSEIVDSSVENFFPNDTWNWYLEIQSQLLAGIVTASESHEWFGARSDNHHFPIEVRMSLIKTLDNYLCILNISDITQRKKEQAEIIKAQETAQSANLAKTKFLSSMSHELRTPLNAIIGYSELVKEDFDFLEKKDILTDVDNILNSGKHLLNLINDVLDLSKVEAGKMHFEYTSVDLQKLLSQINTVVQPLMSKNSNQFEYVLNNAKIMESDETKLKQIILNLLSNSAKFTNNGTVKLAISEESMLGIDWINITISDNGMGMTDAQSKRVFDEFEQADSSISKKFGGTGLGLAISKKFIEIMGGKIHAESLVGKGTTFAIILPKSRNLTISKLHDHQITTQKSKTPQFPSTNRTFVNRRNIE